MSASDQPRETGEGQTANDFPEVEAVFKSKGAIAAALDNETLFYLGRVWDSSSGLYMAEVRGPGRSGHVMCFTRSMVSLKNAEEKATIILRALNSHASDQAKIKGLTEALAPFARMIQWANISDSDNDSDEFMSGAANAIHDICGKRETVLTVGDLRRAASALKESQP